MRVVTISLRSLVRRPVRTALTVAAIAISIAGFVSMLGLTSGVQAALESGLQEPGGDLAVSQQGAFTLTGSAVPMALGSTLRVVPGVKSVDAVMFSLLTADGDVNVPTIGWENNSGFWRTVQIVEGRLPNPDEPGAAIIGQNLASALNKKVGDTIELHFQPFEIVGIGQFSNVLGQSMAVVAIGELQRLMNRPGIASLLQIKLNASDETSLHKARQDIAAVAPGYAVQNIGDLSRSLRLIQVLNALASTASAVIVALSALGIANTLLMAVSERTYEIGILGAIGWPRQRIVLMLLFEGVLMSAAGAIIGIFLGIGVMRVAAKTKFAMGYLQPYIDARMMLAAFFAAIVVGALGALYPAWQASRLAPVEALRRT